MCVRGSANGGLLGDGSPAYPGHRSHTHGFVSPSQHFPSQGGRQGVHQCELPPLEIYEFTTDMINKIASSRAIFGYTVP